MLIPVICWKMKKTQTTTSARLTPGVHWVFCRRCRSVWASSPAASCTRCSETSIPSIPSALLVSANRLCSISHLGDSGIRARSASPTTAGTAPRPRMSLQSAPLAEVGHTGEDQQSNEVRDEDPYGDHPLLDDAELASPVPGRKLCDVRCGDRGIRSNREADERAGAEEHNGVHGHRRQDRPDSVDRGVGDEQRLPPEVVRQWPGHKRARRGSEGGAGDEVACLEARQMVRDER